MQVCFFNAFFISEMILTFNCRTEMSYIGTVGVQTTTFGLGVQPVNEIIHPRVRRDSHIGSKVEII